MGGFIIWWSYHGDGLFLLGLCTVGLFLLLPHKLKSGWKLAHSMRSQFNCFEHYETGSILLKIPFCPKISQFRVEMTQHTAVGAHLVGYFPKLEPRRAQRSTEKPTEAQKSPPSGNNNRVWAKGNSVLYTQKANLTIPQEGSYMILQYWVKYNLYWITKKPHTGDTESLDVCR